MFITSNGQFRQVEEWQLCSFQCRSRGFDYSYQRLQSLQEKLMSGDKSRGKKQVEMFSYFGNQVFFFPASHIAVYSKNYDFWKHSAQTHLSRQLQRRKQWLYSF